MRVTVPVVHQESEIPPEFKHEDNDEYWCFLTNFEFRDSRTTSLKSPEFITEKGVSLMLTGYLLTPEEYKSSPDEKGEYFVKIVNLRQWAFDHEDETRGIWVESKRHWFKLIKPTREFKVIYESFEKKSNIWLDLRPVLTRWIKKFDKCSDEDVKAVINDLTMEYVMKSMKVKGHSEEELIENAFFIHDKAVQDFDTFSFEDSSENQLLRTPFMKDLLELSSEKSKIPIIAKSHSVDKKGKEKQVVTEEDFSSDDEDMDVKIVIDDCSSSEDDDDEEYFVTVKAGLEDEHSKDEHDDDDDDYEETLKKKRTSSQAAKRNTPEKKRPYARRTSKKRTPTKNVDNSENQKEIEKVTPKKRKESTISRETNDDDEDFNESEEEYSSENGKTKQKRRKFEKPRKATVCYFREYTSQPGVPTMEELLNQEFTPRLITQLSTKYEPGLAIPACIPCSLKSQKVCNRELPCNHCENGECYYFTSDNGLLIGEMKIAALKELYAKIDEEKAAKEQSSSDILDNLIKETAQTAEPEEVEIVEEHNEELERNRERAAALREEIKKLKKIAQQETALNERKKKELKEIFNSLSSK
ncbi:predicted protein [Naegleria gruberi]|uniref:Predicted protein n=1 Tax=Naegleria gruberi TaxID=5762 RepID=D2W3H8_NAEGR|nr:uncharacterized protein NAEGRDRAFT_54422 [Naegleria gruberi]EFC36386.1 predicted protein [Naegleria gruberi]|eukprot:XP_002669130.1 predicted protein [Naegleria gruberi strain NEG-M]